jgi:Predicted AAA-ATPase/PD-(D/E)XK nuclease superfamily
MAIQKYPIGLQDFGGIRKNGYVYVDKTPYIHQLITSYKYYFLSRPRRFGKSLLISTLECVFKGQKDLFEGLYIYDKWAFDDYPIIRISFSNIGYRDIGLQAALNTTLDKIANDYGITLENQGISQKFKELIQSLYAKYNKQVVILIDEYDKPIIDYLDKESIHLAHENRGVMKTLYSILKDADPYLKLVFITGVSKFSQVSIFSDLNNLNDITMNMDYNAICGLTQKEVDSYFPQEMAAYDAEKIKKWYNGYRWDSEGESVYNPFSLLSFFSNKGRFNNYWYATGTPTFIMELSKKQHFYSFENTVSSGIDLSSFDIDNILIVPVLFQTGYLTISGYDELFSNYTLSFPNMEVEEAYLQRLADTYIENQQSPAKWILAELNMSLKTKDHTRLRNAINEAFIHIPYPLWEREHEKFYHAIIHLLFSLLGVYIHSEVHTKDGRADAIILYEDHVYCLEFKLNKSAELAVQQVKEKGYLNAYRNKASHFHIIGINFDSEKRMVDGLIWEEV